MTKEDVLKFCETGHHEYESIDVVRSLRGDVRSAPIYSVMGCKLCPSRWLKDL